MTPEMMSPLDKLRAARASVLTSIYVLSKTQEDADAYEDVLAVLGEAQYRLAELVAEATEAIGEFPAELDTNPWDGR